MEGLQNCKSTMSTPTGHLKDHQLNKYKVPHMCKPTKEGTVKDNVKMWPLSANDVKSERGDKK